MEEINGIMKTVSFETAKLAYQKGFKEECDHTITEDKINNGYDYIGQKFDQDHIDAAKEDHGEHYLCPYQYQLMDWLRKEKGYYVHTNGINIRSGNCFWFEVYNLSKNYKFDYDYYDYYYEETGVHNTYEEALEQGLIHALNLI